MRLCAARARVPALRRVPLKPVRRRQPLFKRKRNLLHLPVAPNRQKLPPLKNTRPPPLPPQRALLKKPVGRHPKLRLAVAPMQVLVGQRRQKQRPLIQPDVPARVTLLNQPQLQQLAPNRLYPPLPNNLHPVCPARRLVLVRKLQPKPMRAQKLTDKLPKIPKNLLNRPVQNFKNRPLLPRLRRRQTFSPKLAPNKHQPLNEKPRRAIPLVQRRQNKQVPPLKQNKLVHRLVRHQLQQRRVARQRQPPKLPFVRKRVKLMPMQVARRRVQHLLFARKARQQVGHPLPPPPPKQVVRVLQLRAVSTAQKPPNRNPKQLYPPLPLLAWLFARRVQPKPRKKVHRVLQPSLQIAPKARNGAQLKLLQRR